MSGAFSADKIKEAFENNPKDFQYMLEERMDKTMAGRSPETELFKKQPVLVGRDRELETIKIQFDTVLKGQAAQTVIAGDVGIGKTALLKTAMKDMSELGATCVYGKFEQYKNQEPYIPIIQIIEGITGHILTLPKEKLERITVKLKNRLGKDAAMLTQLVPQTAGIIGRYGKTRVVDYEKLKARLEAAFQI